MAQRLSIDTARDLANEAADRDYDGWETNCGAGIPVTIEGVERWLALRGEARIAQDVFESLLP